MQYYVSSIYEDDMLSIPHAAAVVVIVDLNREDVEWANYRSNNACIGVLEGEAVPCCRLAIYQGISNDH